jgi:hypothetical protein
MAGLWMDLKTYMFVDGAEIECLHHERKRLIRLVDWSWRRRWSLVCGDWRRCFHLDWRRSRRFHRDWRRRHFRLDWMWRRRFHLDWRSLDCGDWRTTRKRLGRMGLL